MTERFLRQRGFQKKKKRIHKENKEEGGGDLVYEGNRNWPLFYSIFQHHKWKGIIKLSSFWAFDHNINKNRESLLDWDDCFCWFGMTLLEVFFLFFFFSFFSQMIAELLLQFSSFHPFWSLSPFHAQIILQMEEPSIIDSWQHERDFSSRIEGFGFCSFFFSSNFLISNFNDLLSFQQCKGQEDLILKKALSGVQRVKCWNRKTQARNVTMVRHLKFPQLKGETSLPPPLLWTDPGWRWDLCDQSAPTLTEDELNLFGSG